MKIRNCYYYLIVKKKMTIVKKKMNLTLMRMKMTKTDLMNYYLILNLMSWINCYSNYRIKMSCLMKTTSLNCYCWIYYCLMRINLNYSNSIDLKKMKILMNYYLNLNYLTKRILNYCYWNYSIMIMNCYYWRIDLNLKKIVNLKMTRKTYWTSYLNSKDYYLIKKMTTTMMRMKKVNYWNCLNYSMTKRIDLRNCLTDYCWKKTVTMKNL